MEEYELPPELEQLQQDLAACWRPGPPADLRQRVIGGIRAELRRDRSRARWAFAAAMAAAALVWINLSLSATRATDYHLQFGSKRPPVEAAAEQIQQLLPEIPRREALRQAALLQAGSNLAWYPNFPAHPAAPGRLSALDDLLP